jgi:chromosome segregation ATPase
MKEEECNMKKIAIVIVFVCGFSAAYSQQISLDQSVYDTMRDRQRILQDSVKMLKDSIIKMDSTILEINKKLNNANNEVSTLNKNTVKIERDKLLQQISNLQTDTATLRRQLSEKNTQIEKEAAECQQKEQEQYKKGQRSVSQQIERTYQGNFDTLIKLSTKQSIERDVRLVSNKEIKTKMQDLQKYFAAKQVLSEKYDEQKIKVLQAQLSSIEQTELVKNLTDNLEKYKMRSDALKSTIGKIQDIDRKITANSDYSKQEKLKLIMPELSSYCYNYSFNYYPYLVDIVLEIVKRKQKDANASITDLLGKL